MSIWPWSRIRQLEAELKRAKEANVALCDANNWIVISEDNTTLRNVHVEGDRKIYVDAKYLLIDGLVVKSSAYLETHA